MWTCWCADTHHSGEVQHILSSFWKAGGEGRGNWKVQRYLSCIKHRLTNGTNINNTAINCCLVVVEVTFSSVELSEKLMCLLMWSRWLSLESSNKESFLVNYFIMLNRQFSSMTLGLVCWLYVQGIKYTLLALCWLLKMQSQNTMQLPGLTECVTTSICSYYIFSVLTACERVA